jgi:hypothetical protein
MNGGAIPACENAPADSLTTRSCRGTHMLRKVVRADGCKFGVELLGGSRVASIQKNQK